MSGKATTEKNKIKKVESLPEGWKRVRLGEIIEEVNERVGKKNLEPVAIGINGIKKRSDIYYKELAEDYSNNKILRTGYIAFGLGSNEMAIGVNFFENDFCVSPAYKVFKNKDQDILFSHYFFDYFKRIVGSKFLILSARQGKAVDFSLLLNEYVLLPPLPEQQKIAEILETVDNAIEKTDVIIEKYRRIKKGLMADLLTGKIRLIPYGHSEAEGEESPLLTSPEAKKFVIGDKTFVVVPNQKWKNTSIGKIPEGWEVKKLGEVIRKIVDNRGRTPPIFEEGVELIETNCITDKDKKHPDFSKIRKYVNRYIYNTWFRSGHPEINDILIATVGENVGSAAIMNVSRGCIAQNLVALKLNENVIPDFVYYLFISEYFYKQVFAVLMMAAQPSLKLPHLLNFVFPLPPLPEQQLIADVLSQIDEVIEKEIQYKEKLERIKKGLMEDLLTGKVRVNNLIKKEI